MKSIKFSLAVLMLAAAFTACTKDEMVSSQVDPMQKELVGAELLGTNISVNFGQDTDTKLYGSTWADTDLLGLGWVVKGNYGDIQDGTEPDNSRLAANHMFAKGENGFTTKGNVYKGWHFAYFPFKYEEQVFVEKTIDNMNPVQTEVYDTDRYNTAFYISAKEFLTAEDHLTKDNQLENVTFDLFRAFKTIGVTVKPDASIKSDDVLKTLAIKSVTIRTADKKPFAVGGFTLKPNLLASMAYDEDGEYDKAATKEALYTSLEDAIVRSVPSYKNSITTEVDNENINLGGDQTIRFYTMPRHLTLTSVMKDITVEVVVENGSFVIGYTDPEDLDDDEVLTAEQEANNDAIEALVAAYSNAETGTMTSYNVGNGVLEFAVSITKGMFNEDFDAIKSETQWNKAVSLVDALELESVNFTTAGNWAFTSDIKLPNTAKLTVGGNKLQLNGTTSWPTQVVNEDDEITNFIVNTDVEVKANLNVAGLMTVNGNIINKAEIYAGASANIKNLNNVNGRVIVEYGAQVNAGLEDINTPAFERGTIAYVVNDATATTISRINTLIGSDKVNVNTLIVKTALNLKALAKAEVAGDVYGGEDGAHYLTDLNTIAVELNGGSLTAATGKTAVKSVKATAGTTSINGIDLIGNDLTVEAGVMTATNVKFNDDDVITVDEDAELNVNFDTLITYYIKNIVNEGTLNINNVCLDVEKVDNTKGTMVIADGSHIFYSTEYKQGGTVTGTVLNANNCPEIVVNSKETLTKAIAEAAANTTIKLASNVNLDEALVFNKDMKLDLNGKTLNSKEYAIKVTAGILTIKGNGVVYGNSDNSGSCSAVFANGGDVVIENGTFKVGDDAQTDVNDYTQCNPCIYAAGSSEITVKGGEFMYAGKNKFGCEWLLNCNNSSSAKINVKGGKFHNFDPAHITSYNPEQNFVATGFKSVKTVTNTTTGAFYCTVVANN